MLPPRPSRGLNEWRASGGQRNTLILNDRNASWVSRHSERESRLSRRGVIGFAVVAASVGLSLAVTFVSAHGGDTSQVHACAENKSGDLRLVRSGDSCKSGETAIDWSIVGPTGPTGLVGLAGPQGLQGERGIAGETGAAGAAGSNGAVGAAGPQGAPGRDGTSGVANYQVFFQTVVIPAGSFFRFNPSCPPPRVAIGGGYGFQDFGPGFRVFGAGIQSSASTAYEINGANDTDIERQGTIYVTCADVGSVLPSQRIP